MDIEYVDIVTGEVLSLIYVTNIVLRYGLMCSSMIRGGDGVKNREMGGIVILASCWEKQLIRVCENVSQYPLFYIHYKIDI